MRNLIQILDAPFGDAVREGDGRAGEMPERLKLMRLDGTHSDSSAAFRSIGRTNGFTGGSRGASRGRVDETAHVRAGRNQSRTASSRPKRRRRV